MEHWHVTAKQMQGKESPGMIESIFQDNSETRPWSRWWWFGCAVDRKTIKQLLETYSKAGLGGVEITFIYGVRGSESKNIKYLSSEWREMVQYTVSEAQRLGMEVDITLGSGWRTGGSFITDDIAAAQFSVEKTRRGPEIKCNPTGEPVKRSGPGGKGKAFNPFSRSSVDTVLKHFQPHFENLGVRAQFHDSWEYQSNICPEIFERFEATNGYELQDFAEELAGNGDPEKVARVRYDFHNTLSRLALEDFIIPWTEWCHSLGHLSRNQAHGSPGNQLDLYAAADIPETESYRFVTPDTPLIAKLASSAAHVAGRKLISSETGTWCKEHFHVTLADLKSIIDNLFVSGINQIVYHGTAYSPPEADWPGWLFYASCQLNPQNSIWRDFEKLNQYVMRCQTILQAGKASGELLVYLPLHDIFHNPDHEPGAILGIKGDWLRQLESIDTVRMLWRSGYEFDYISDRQIENLSCNESRLIAPGGEYKAILVPPCRYLPLQTLKALERLAIQGARIVFMADNPGMPGMAKMEKAEFDSFKLLLRKFSVQTNIKEILHDLKIFRENLPDNDNLFYIRRKGTGYFDYFISNRGTASFDKTIELSVPGKAIVIIDPMTGKCGKAQTETNESGKTSFRLQLNPGQSLIARLYGDENPEETKNEDPWIYNLPKGDFFELQGKWEIEFIEGGPTLPPAYATEKLVSWTEFNSECENFSGTARYRIDFDTPPGYGACILDLGTVHSSARVYLNGVYVDTLIGPSFMVTLDSLNPGHNTLEIEVTNLSANRIRDLDRQKVDWKIFEDINFISWDLQPFDASDWPTLPSGLLGPVRLHELCRNL